MAYLAGRCFTGTLPNGHVDTHCFQGIYGGAFIRDRHVVTGGTRPYCGETVYAPARGDQPMRFWYWASSGDVSEGTVQFRPGALVFPETVTGDAGTVDYRSTWRMGPGGYQSLLEEPRNGPWVVLRDIDFTAAEDPDRYGDLCGAAG